MAAIVVHATLFQIHATMRMRTTFIKIACTVWLCALSATPLQANNNPPFQFIPLDGVLFDIGKADLKTDAKILLDEAAKYLRNNLALQRVIIEGHTDETGRRNKNYHLSDQRATAVRNYLIAKGVPPDLVQLAGHGEDQPVDEPWSRSGRKRNRHVEIFAVIRE